jgi:lysozyme
MSCWPFNKPSEVQKPEVKPEPQKPIETKVEGVDVSHHNGAVDWEKLKAHGIVFMFAKITEGTSFIDPLYLDHIKHAKAAGLITGAYHFFHHNEDATAQAKHFIETVKKLQIPDLPLVLDWEQQGGTKNQINEAMHFLNIIELNFNRVPIIYGSTSFLEDFKLPNSFDRYPLWLANYARPRVPKPWSKYTFWQDSEAKVYDGLKGSFDHNWFDGSLADLKSLL